MERSIPIVISKHNNIQSYLNKKGEHRYITFQPVPTKSPYKTGGRYAYQASFLKDYAFKHNHLVAVLPTGSGKSILMMTYIAQRAKQKKCTVVLVPKLGIATGFEKYINNGAFSIDVEGLGTFSLPSLTGREVNPTNNKVTEVVNLIETRKPMIICSYQAMIGAWGKLSDEAKKDVAFLLDEGHHSGMDFGEMDNGGTKIGEIIDLACKEDIPIHIYTATDFRSDGRSLVPEHTDFVTFRRSLKTHFDEGCCPDFCMYFRFYDKVKIKQYEELDNNGSIGDDVKIGNIGKLIYSYVDEYKQNQRPTLMIIPQKIRGHDLKKYGNSAGVAFALDNELKKNFPGIKILNLGSIDGKTYEASKPHIREKYEKLSTDTFDVVISIRVADEGIDWPDCSQVFFPRVPGSLGLIVQRVGRAMRGKEGKSFSRIVFFELGVYQEEGKDFQLCDAMLKLVIRLKALYYGLEWTDVCKEWGSGNVEGDGNQALDFLDSYKFNPAMCYRINQQIDKFLINNFNKSTLLTLFDEDGNKLYNFCAEKFKEEGIEVNEKDIIKFLTRFGHVDITGDNLKRFIDRLTELGIKTHLLGDKVLQEIWASAKIVGVGDFLKLFDDRNGSIVDFDRVVSEYVKSSADENKRILLEMARRGDPRPSSKSKKGEE